MTDCQPLPATVTAPSSAGRTVPLQARRQNPFLLALTAGLFVTASTAHAATYTWAVSTQTPS